MMTCLLLKLENPILWKGCLDEVDVWQLAIISPDTPANQHNISLTSLSAQTTFFSIWLPKQNAHTWRTATVNKEWPKYDPQPQFQKKLECCVNKNWMICKSHKPLFASNQIICSGGCPKNASLLILDQ